MQTSVGFLDLDLFTSTNISQRSQQDGKAISNAMNNDYMVGACDHLYEVQRGLVSRFC
jgi:hypothetical protein